MAQAHDGMFPQHARSGVTHHHLDLLASCALITMDRALGAGRFFRTKPAAFQSHPGVIQKLPAFRAQPGCRPMTIPAVDFDHRLHCLPFTVQPLAGESHGLGFGRDVSKGVRSGLFSNQSHTVTFAHPLSKAFDAGQGFDHFMGSAVKRKSLTWVKSVLARMSDNCRVRNNRVL